MNQLFKNKLILIAKFFIKNLMIKDSLFGEQKQEYNTLEDIIDEENLA